MQLSVAITNVKYLRLSMLLMFIRLHASCSIYIVHLDKYDFFIYHTATLTPRNATASVRLLEPTDWPTTACTHNGSVFANGSLVPTMEPCLSCQCMNKTLRCARRICNEMPMPPPRGCALVQRRDSCCPFIVCSKTSSVSAFQNRIGVSDSNRWANRNSNSLELPEDEEDDESYTGEQGDDGTNSNLCQYMECTNIFSQNFPKTSCLYLQWHRLQVWICYDIIVIVHLLLLHSRAATLCQTAMSSAKECHWQ